MGVLSRFKDIMEANVNSILSKAEEKNADKLLEKYLRDAQDNLSKVKSETAAVIADEKAAQRKLDECNANIEKYNKYAMQAVQAGNDDDARKFLKAKADFTSQLETLQKAYEMAKSNSEKMKQMTDKLTDDIAAAQKKVAEMNAKLAIAKQQEQQAEFNKKLSNTTGLDNIDGLMDAVQKRIDKAEALSELNNNDEADELKDLEDKYSGNSADIEAELNALKNGASSEIDDELAKMKESLGM